MVGTLFSGLARNTAREIAICREYCQSNRLSHGKYNESRRGPMSHNRPTEPLHTARFPTAGLALRRETPRTRSDHVLAQIARSTAQGTA